MARRRALSSETSKHTDVLLDRLAQIEAGDTVNVDDLDRAYQLAFNAAHAARPDSARPNVAAIRSASQIVGDRIRSIRNDAGATQEELAAAMTRIGFDWKRVTVAEVETDRRRVSVEELVGLAIAFSVPAVWFLLPEGDYLALPPKRALDPPEVFELLCGPGAQLGAVYGTWELPARLARAEVGDADWRPARELHRRREAGYGGSGQ